MKKSILIIMAVILGAGTAFAGPVDQNTAKSVGQKFVMANFKAAGNATIEHVYTFTDDSGAASVYVYNVGENGFVMVSADDNFRPIVGFSDEDVFDVDNMSPEMLYYLDVVVQGRNLLKNRTVNNKVVLEWQRVQDNGRLLSYNGGRGVDYLVQSKWNQSPAPYNSMCPADPLGDGGHVYVGCVATAMSQLMKYWNYPTQGNDSHSYMCYPNPAAGYAGHLEYGTLTANFGQTTYDWANMLNSYSTGYSTEEGDAVATLCYHCGVSVDMMYGNNNDGGSGAYSQDVPYSISHYFLYSTAATVRNYSNLNTWEDMLKEQFDLGWPVYYSGSSSEGGHAFICDGYNDNDYFHFNWGWGGSGNGWFIPNEIDYNTGMAAIINFVPADVYNNTAQAPTNMTVTKTSDVAQEAIINWTNPTKTLNNQNLTTIDQVVVERQGEVIYVAENATPGAAMSFLDSDVPCYSTFEYRVYTVINGARGKYVSASESFGPTCEWKIVATSSNMAGWKGGKIIAYDGAGREITSFTMTNSNPVTASIDLTIGKVQFAWEAGTDNVVLSFKIKDTSGAVVYEFTQGNSSSLDEGVFYVGNNSCGNAAPTNIPGDLNAVVDGDNIILTWTETGKDAYGYNIYRDGTLCYLAHTNEFIDEAPSIGGHCYQVCALSDGGESEPSNEACATFGEGCDAGSDLWFEMQANGKPIINWVAPETEGLSGFYVYRKMNENGEYTQIKAIAPNKTEYKETKTLEDGNWYYYKVVAAYTDIDCISAPFKAKYGDEYFVKIYYSVTGVGETASQVSLYPNPTKDSFTIEGENLQQVMVYNTVGQLVYTRNCEGNNAVINLGNVETGMYLVKVLTANGDYVKKISVVK